MNSKRAPIFKDINDLAVYLKAQNPAGVVLANGCFDPLHVGHIRYLEGARKHGSFLVVALNDDSSTRVLKGGGRPVVPERDRAVMLSGLKTVDAVLVFARADVREILETIRPDVYAKGRDYTVETVPELETTRKLGIQTVIAGDPKSHASSDVLKGLRRRAGKEDEA